MKYAIQITSPDGKDCGTTPVIPGKNAPWDYVDGSYGALDWMFEQGLDDSDAEKTLGDVECFFSYRCMVDGSSARTESGWSGRIVKDI
jgi:hypothetical protein